FVIPSGLHSEKMHFQYSLQPCLGSEYFHGPEVSMFRLRTAHAHLVLQGKLYVQDCKSCMLAGLV
ncbi:MAG: hypothetical protein OEQ24_04790, partial [Gammaproteobacteria bacterium]|nr:hypothetical protein [Gammaproteobacteria bacterium]